MPDQTGQNLATIQRWFQSVISHPEGVEAGIDAAEAQKLIGLKRTELEKVIRRSKNLTAEERLGVYANAYYARLLECLRESFPVLAKTLGREVFDEFAFDYLQRYPSTSYTLNRLGDRFADFLGETRPDRTPDQPNPPVNWPDFLIDLTHLEWNIEQVFDGPGVEGEKVLSTDDLRSLDAARFGDAKLSPVVCLRLLTFKYPVNEYYTQARKIKQGEATPPPPEPGEQFLALTRRDFVVRRTPLSASQHALFAALQTGKSIAESIAAAAEHSELSDEAFVAAIREWFAAWTAAGFFHRAAI
jgi:hypothetical protein